MQICELIATVFVQDTAEAWDWYSRVFDRRWDAEPDTGCRAWQVKPDAWFQVVGQEEGRVSSSVALAVPSASAAIEELASRGITAGEPTAIPDFATFVELTDPAGNQVTLVEQAAGGTLQMGRQDP